MDILKCRICGKEYRDLGNLSKHIKNYHKIELQNYYDKFLLKDIKEKTCKRCSKNTKFLSIKKGYNQGCSLNCNLKITKLERYGDENYTNIEKNKRTCLKRYGVDNVSKLDSTIHKIKETKHERYGDENYNNREDAVKTCLERYGNENYKNPDKNKQTKLERYGDENYNNRPLMKQTKLERYGNENYNNTKQNKKTTFKNWGVYHCLQHQDLLNKAIKSAHTFKDYMLPSGKTIKVQGYEPKALDILFKQGYKEEDLIIQQRKEMPEIWYHTSDKKKHRYYPDIFIISENKIIEVKSEWTYNLHLKKNLLKQQACLDAGYKFEFKIL